MSSASTSKMPHFNGSISVHEHFQKMCPMSLSGRENHVKEHELWKRLEENLTMDQFLSDFSDSLYCHQINFEWTISIVVPIIFAIIVILGVIGNILVLVVVLVKHQMRNTTNVLIVVST